MVSGLTKEEAIEVVQKELSYQMNDHIELIYKNYNYYVEIEQIEAEFDIESSVEYVYNIAKSGNFFKDVKDYISVLMTHVNIEPKLIYNDEALCHICKLLKQIFQIQLQQYGYYIEDDELIITME